MAPFMGYKVAFALVVACASLSGQESRTDLHGDPLPKGAVARMGTVRLRPSSPPNGYSAAGFAPKTGALLLFEGASISSWDAATS